MKQHGDTVAGKKIEIIRKDIGGVAPDVAKRLAQELVVRDKVDILAGWVLTPNALAAADVSAQAKKFMVVMNAATSIIITKSPYMVRTSVTLPQIMDTFGRWAAKSGIKKCYTMVTDYGPGHDSEAAFQRAFKEAGGEIVGSVRFPVANPDFSAFMQRAKDLESGMHLHLRAGRRAAGRARQGVRRARRRSQEDQDPGLGRNHRRSRRSQAWATRRSASSRRGTTTTRARRRTTSSSSSSSTRCTSATRTSSRSAATTACTLIYEALKKTGGKTDGESLITAAKGMKWDSPRGPMSIDPETRDVVQTVYIRRVEKVGGELINVPFDKIENVKDPSKARGG